MSLYSTISADVVTAMKAKDEFRLSVLRMVKAALKNVAIEQKKGDADLTDDEVVELLRREVKKRRESARMYREGGRTESAESEEKEVALLEQYLPQQLSEDELKKIVSEVIAQNDDPAQNAGRIVGAVMTKVKGSADGATVKRLVEAAIAS